MDIPRLITHDRELDDAFRIAVGDVLGNVVPYRDGVLEREVPSLMAGLDYDTPWTRDASINAWNAVSIFWPEIARNTLISVLENTGHGLEIGGQYWDAIIWAVGAWEHYLATGDRKFLERALEATRNSLQGFERSELNPDTGLFRGPAVYGDGVAAYPDRYARTEGGSPSILKWPAANPSARAPRGFGVAMQALSTNCVYVRAYEVASLMAAELGREGDPSWAERARSLREAIERHFWDDARGAYRYIVDEEGADDAQEGLGVSFALLFGLADKERTRTVLDGLKMTPAGISCVEPSYGRYLALGGFGRHSGTVWPHVQGFFADAAARAGRHDLFEREMRLLARFACRDAQFTEIYHPTTGLPYGGLQERSDKGITAWKSCRRQTWSATAYMRMIISGIFGLRPGTDGLRFEPRLPAGVRQARISGLRYRGAGLALEVVGEGAEVARIEFDGSPVEAPFIPASSTPPGLVRFELT